MPEKDPREQPGRVSGMFGRIAGWYDFLNHFLSLGLDILWRRRLVRVVRPGSTGRFLDLAAGTLDVTRELLRSHPGCRVLAMDFSEPMLAKGLPKLENRPGRALPVLADGRALPLPGASVDGVTIAFGIRNIRPRQAAYAEILRVLAPGGRLAILEFGTSRRLIWKGLYNVYLHAVLPLVGRLVSGDKQAYSYLARTIADFPTARELEDELRAAGFVNVSHTPLASGIVNIHVAERRTFEGDLFVVGGSAGAAAHPADGRPPKAEQAAEAKDFSAMADAAPAKPAAPGDAVAEAAARTAAGLQAMEAALAAAPKPTRAAGAKKAAPKTAAQKSTVKKTTVKKTAAPKAKAAAVKTAKAEAPAKAEASGTKASKKAAPKGKKATEPKSGTVKKDAGTAKKAPAKRTKKTQE